jgi:hypothetical protein
VVKKTRSFFGEFSYFRRDSLLIQEIERRTNDSAAHAVIQGGHKGANVPRGNATGGVWNWTRCLVSVVNP